MIYTTSTSFLILFRRKPFLELTSHPTLQSHYLTRLVKFPPFWHFLQSFLMALKRLSKELRDLEKNKDEVFTLTPTSTDDLFHWTGILNGPKGSPYEGGIFTLNIDIPQAYPMEPPEVMFETKVYHPNISDSGDICLDTLADQWSPALTLGKVGQKLFF